MNARQHLPYVTYRYFAGQVLLLTSQSIAQSKEYLILTENIKLID